MTLDRWYLLHLERCPTAHLSNTLVNVMDIWHVMYRKFHNFFRKCLPWYVRKVSCKMLTPEIPVLVQCDQLVSFWSCVQSPFDLVSLNGVQSSANIRIDEYKLSLWSSTYTRSKKCPKMEAWGTPDDTGDHSEIGHPLAPSAVGWIRINYPEYQYSQALKAVSSFSLTWLTLQLKDLLL